MLQKKLNQITIRKAVTSDVSILQAFIFIHGPNPWNYLPEDEVKAHIAEISTKKVQAFLAEVDGECVGFACFYLGLPANYQKYEKDQASKVAYLSEIVVHCDYTGQSIGSKLINAIKEHLINNNITKLYTERHADNMSSAGVMIKTGFKIIDEYDDEQRRPNGSRRTAVTRVEL